ncbi:H+ symporter [Xylariaceae sp. FL0804]|nr:H+ symporter [Xylariaceae sp. FL0804]
MERWPPESATATATTTATATGPRHSDGGNRAFHNFFNDFAHIQDPNLRRRLALSEIDKVPFGTHHVRAVLVAGVGFLLDSYDIFAINLVTTLLGVVFWPGPPGQQAGQHGYGGNNGTLPMAVSQALKASTSAGIVIGQVLFGWLADRYGRRRMYGLELALIVVSTLGCSLVAASESVSVTGLMTFWRVMMGIGIGGDYPLSSVITAEFAPTRWRGAMMAAVFSMQGIGQLLAAVVTVIVTVSFKPTFDAIDGVDQCGPACQSAADKSWRIIIGLGALPALFAFYYRVTIPETPRYTFEVARDAEKAVADIRAYTTEHRGDGVVDEVKQARIKSAASPALNVQSASWRDLHAYFTQWANAKTLFGTTLSWFFLDLAFYGLGLNNGIVLQAIGYADGGSLYEVLYNNAVGTIILVVAGSLPGYWTAILLVDTIGRKTMQIVGFAVLTVVFCLLGFLYHRLSRGALLALYVVANFFFNFGPNTTTFLIPGECFPTRYRATGHGISAASGKIGAIVAQVISLPLLTRDAPAGCHGGGCTPWLPRLIQIFALFMVCGTLASLLVPETKGYTLEELSGEPPTSYNAGRNGSIDEDRGGGAARHWWNPFGDRGRPAGFSYRSRGLRRRSVGPVMASPEPMMAEDQRPGRRNFLGGGRSRTFTAAARGGTIEDGEGDGCYPESTSSTAPFAAATDEPPLPTAGILPGWGAGWGRIDRGGNPLTLENIQLQDIGRLLK